LSRILFCSEEFPKHIGLPRGCFPDVENLFNSLGVEIKIIDERFRGKPLRAGFKGKLRAQQKHAVKELRKHDIGILSAATAFGKTVVAAKLIAIRKRNTLILIQMVDAHFMVDCQLDQKQSKGKSVPVKIGGERANWKRKHMLRNNGVNLKVRCSVVIEIRSDRFCKPI
jgi:superfamily II DNA or RNA helicase